MTDTQKSKIEKIRNSYTETDAPKSDFEKLKDLDRAVKKPATIFAYTYGTVGSLVLGTGMCFAMKVLGASIPALMWAGIGIGIVGIAMVSSTYFFYKKILNKRKSKHLDKVLEISNKLLNEEGE